MTQKRRSGALLAPLCAVTFLFVTASPAAASCAEPVPTPEAITSATTVFIGTVTDLDHEDRVAVFQVEEIWKGAIGESAVVSGGPAAAELETARAQGQTVFTSVDRTYVRGERYLVVSHTTDGTVLMDNACSATQVYHPDLVEFRPATAHAPTGSDAGGTDNPIDREAEGSKAWLWIGAAVAAALTATAAGVEWRHRRRAVRA